MPPRNKCTPLCITSPDRLTLKTKLLTHLSTHPTLSFPSPSIPPKDQLIPLQITHSQHTYTSFSSLLSSLHKSSLTLPLTPQQRHWLRKFCYVSFFYRGASTSGFQELVPRAFLRLSATERGFVKSELGKANGQARARMVPMGVLGVAIYFLLKGGFFPPDSTNQDKEDDESLFLPTQSTSTETEHVPFTSYTEHRHSYWKACLDAKPWIVIWWISKCVGHVIDVAWIWQTKPETDLKLATLKSDLQAEIPEAMIKLLDSVYLHLIDHDVKTSGNGGGIFGDSGVGSGNAAVNTTLTKLFTHSKHKLEEWPVHSAKMEDIRETRDLWDEVCRYNKEGRRNEVTESTGMRHELNGKEGEVSNAEDEETGDAESGSEDEESKSESASETESD